MAGERRRRIEAGLLCCAFVVSVLPIRAVAQKPTWDESTTDPIKTRTEIGKWQRFARENPDNWYELTGAIMAQVKLHSKLGETANAERSIREGAAIFQRAEISGIPTPLIKEKWIEWQVYFLYRDAGRFDDALAARSRAVEAERRFMAAVKIPEDDRALRSLKIHPSSDADIYEKWGKLTTAREKNDDMIRFLSSPETERDILSKLKEKEREGWEMNRDFCLPLKVAQLHIKEGTAAEAQKVLAVLRERLQDPAFVKRHTGEPLARDYFEFSKKQAEEAMRACGME
jgi:tetratricopeptide (TPR) repeat protein